MSPSTRNLWTTLLLSLCCMVLGPVEAATLSKEDAEFLRQDIATMMTSFEQGDIDALLGRTHPALFKLVGDRDAFFTDGTTGT